MNANEAIRESIQKTSIIVLFADLELADELLAKSEGDVRSGDIHEYWGVHDGNEWRVHLSYEGMVLVETMPECHRASHRAAGNWGVYPANGAERMLMTRDEAEELIEDDEDGYTHIIEES